MDTDARPPDPTPADPPPPDPDDESVTRHLARGAQAGDEARFSALCERLAPALYGWSVLRIPPELRARLQPEDLMQDVWLRALSAFGSYDADRGPLRPWLFQVAKYTLLDALRRGRVRVQPRQEPAPDGGSDAGGGARLSQVPDDATAVSQRVARRDDVAAFLAHVETLPEEDRDLLVHHGLEGLSLGQAAERLGLEKAAAQKRWQRLRARLAEHGWPEGMFEPGA